MKDIIKNNNIEKQKVKKKPIKIIKKSKLKLLKKLVARSKKYTYTKTYGYIQTIADGVCFLAGVSNLYYGEVVKFINIKEDNKALKGIILSLGPERGEAAVLVLGSDKKLIPGILVGKTGGLLKIRRKNTYLGKVITPTGKTLLTS